jgi:hypothetical protein
MNIYLAIPIDKAKDNPVRDGLKDLIWEQLRFLEKSVHVLVFDPESAFHAWSSITDKEIGYLEAINKKAMLSADMVVFAYIPGVETWGEPMELNMCFHENVPFVMVHSNTAIVNNVILGKPAQYIDLPIYLRHRLREDRYIPVSILARTIYGDPDDALSMYSVWKTHP